MRGLRHDAMFGRCGLIQYKCEYGQEDMPRSSAHVDAPFVQRTSARQMRSRQRGTRARRWSIDQSRQGNDEVNVGIAVAAW